MPTTTAGVLSIKITNINIGQLTPLTMAPHSPALMPGTGNKAAFQWSSASGSSAFTVGAEEDATDDALVAAFAAALAAHRRDRRRENQQAAIEQLPPLQSLPTSSPSARTASVTSTPSVSLTPTASSPSTPSASSTPGSPRAIKHPESSPPRVVNTSGGQDRVVEPEQEEDDWLIYDWLNIVTGEDTESDIVPELHIVRTIKNMTSKRTASGQQRSRATLEPGSRAGEPESGSRAAGAGRGNAGPGYKSSAKDIRPTRTMTAPPAPCTAATPVSSRIPWVQPACDPLPWGPRRGARVTEPSLPVHPQAPVPAITPISPAISAMENKRARRRIQARRSPSKPSVAVQEPAAQCLDSNASSASDSKPSNYSTQHLKPSLEQPSHVSSHIVPVLEPLSQVLATTASSGPVPEARISDSSAVETSDQALELRPSGTSAPASAPAKTFPVPLAQQRMTSPGTAFPTRAMRRHSRRAIPDHPSITSERNELVKQGTQVIYEDIAEIFSPIYFSHNNNLSDKAPARNLAPKIVYDSLNKAPVCHLASTVVSTVASPPLQPDASAASPPLQPDASVKRALGTTSALRAIRRKDRATTAAREGT